MPEIIQNWLGTTLGVVLDMSPEKFGRNTKDGKLLAQVLYNYNVIPTYIFNEVKESKNFYECYNNLVTLKPWLRYIGVTQEDSTLKKMASGEGSAAISVFYAVYLNLERKDRLHYLSAQKERRFSAESCQKFKVSWVPEKCLAVESGDSSTARAPEVQQMIEWHRAKCREVVEQIKRTKAKFQKITEKKPLGPLVSKHASSRPLEKRQSEAEETRENINEFEKKHPCNNPNLNFSELRELQNLYEMQPCIYPSLSEAKNIMGNIKRRKKGDIYARSFQSKMQDILLDEQWKEIVKKQEKDFESKVCSNLLKQSQYEKQMANKLFLLRNQKKVLAENRKKIESLKLDQCQKEYDEVIQKNLEMRGEYWEEEEFETERIAELHRRLYDEKARLRRSKLKAECEKILAALVDISIRISEVRELIGCQLPKSFMKDLKELFFKDLSIFDLLDHLEELHNVEPRPNMGIPCECEGEEEGVLLEHDNYGYFAEEKSRQSILDECDFNDYIHLMGPWMVDLLFPNDSESEVKHLVLGYIVHKLLAVKYPPPNLPVRLDIKPMRPTSVVQGFADENATNMLVDLMEICGILVVRVEDAINFVLSAYKEELSVVRDIDIAFQKATDKALKQKSNAGKENEVKKKVQLLKKENKEVETSVEEPFRQEKETQTPRMIPDDDPLLSPNAELGKQAFEALGAGDPVSDPVIVSSIIAYVVSRQDNYDGWVLLNYPILYSQASNLEYFLTGCRILPDMEEMETLEEAEGFCYRGPWGNPFTTDDFSEYRNSRLVPKPDIFTPVETVVPKTYFSSFIKMKKIVETPSRRPREPEAPEELDPLEKFYSDIGILFNFEYPNLSFQTVKNLGKIIVGVVSGENTNWGLEPKTSLEIFGEAVLNLNEKWGPAKKTTKNLGGGTKKAPETLRNYEIEVAEEQGGVEEEEVKTEVEVAGPPPKPGDPTWEWATGQQPEPLLIALACLWESMEAVYTEDFKNVFFYLRVHRSNLIEYTGFVRKSIRTLMARSDDKQKFLADFQQMYNEIDEDLRPDVDVKCELHVRVSELQQALMSMADERKANSLKDVTMAAQDGWVPDEMANLVNIFLTAIQLEVDRCLTSCQVIGDYYTSLLQKIPDERQLRKVSVPKLQIQDRKYSVFSTNSSKTMSSSVMTPRASDFKRSVKSFPDQGVKSTRDRSSKTRGLNERRRRSSDIVAGAAEFLMGVLTNLSFPEDGTTPFHSFFLDNVHAVANEVKIIVEGCISDAKKNEKPPPNPNKNAKSNKTSEETKTVIQNGNPTAEWLTALENELSRFNFRTQLILARGIFEMNEFLTTILNMLSSLSEEVSEMYLKEIHSISECCKVFKCAIEEEIQIRPILELKVDEFFVHMSDEVPPSTEETADVDGDEEERRFHFTIEQLSLLFHKLQRVAPDGEIIKRSLVYIIEDLRVLKSEVESCFPVVWNDIEPDDVTTIMDEVFQDLEIVHWKDFIIYALELSLPTEAEILSMRRCFRNLDPQITELITRENYDAIPLWFEKPSDSAQGREETERVKEFLYTMYQVDHSQTNYSALLLAFCKDEDPVVGFKKALALAMGKVVRVPEEIPEQLSVPGENDDFGQFSDGVSRHSFEKPCCCPTNSTEVSMKCIPKERIVRCNCKDESETSTGGSTEGEKFSYPEHEGEAYFYYDSYPEKSFVASVVPYSILSSLLKASFPSLPQLSILLDCQHTFQETLSLIYDSLESQNNTVEVQKLLNHNFINRLLHSTNKFKFVKLKPILLSVAKFQSPASRVTCVKDKPNVSPCLRN